MDVSTPISNLITGTVMYNRMIREIVTSQTSFTLTQYRILLYLEICSRKAQRIRDIAQVLILSTSTVSDTASELEKTGWYAVSKFPAI